MPFQIRNANPEDIPNIVSIVREANGVVARKLGITAENAPTHPSNCQPFWIEENFKKGLRYFILLEDGKPVGCAALEKASDTVCYLERLAVLPESQQKGYGRALVGHCFRTARQWGARTISIGIIREHTVLMEWYRSLGFRIVRHKDFDHLPFGVTFMEIEMNIENRMKTVEAKASSYFASGMNCAESVCKAVTEDCSHEFDSILPGAASAFGGGVGSCRQELCGALSGGCIAIGLLKGRCATEGDGEAKRLGAELRQRFLDYYGVTQCQALIDQFGEEDRRAKCQQLVGVIASETVQLIEEG